MLFRPPPPAPAPMKSRPLSRSNAAFVASLPTTLAVALTLCACGGGGSGPEGSSPAAPQFGLAERVVVEGLAFPPAVPPASAVELVDAFPSFGGGGVAMAADQAGRFFRGDKDGRIWSFDAAGGGGESLFLDLSAKVIDSNEAGLLGLCFDPADGAAGALYLSYVADNPLRSVVARIPRSSADPLVGDATQEFVLFERPRNSTLHCGGGLAFGPDGYLYASFGDDLNPDNAQDLGNYHGSILRMDEGGAPAPGNPFAAGPGDAPWIHAFGLRNAWRFSFDRGTGDLWCGDVGESSREEINRILPGRNYGWPAFEGELEFYNPGNLPYASFEPPLHTYAHTEGKSVIGGFVYRGTAFPQLFGRYLFGDFVSGRIWGLVLDAQGDAQVAELSVGAAWMVTFLEDQSGELWLSKSGELLRIEASDPAGAPTIPPLLSETGIFANLVFLDPVPGVLPYDVVSPLWSDGAEKRRWIALPGLETIGFAEQGPWTFPDGTVFVKHFEIELASGVTRRLETRVLWSDRGQWQGVTYRWNEAGDDALLLSQAETVSLEVPDATAPSGSVVFDWRFPSPADCLACHNASAGHVLGVRAAQLNRDFAYGLIVDNQLRAWNNIELFGADIGPVEAIETEPLVDPADVGAGLALRARSYLAANCAHCHNDATPLPVMDLAPGVALVDTGLVGVGVTFGYPGFLQGDVRVQPFDKETSVLWERMASLLPFLRMPLLGSNRLDPLGLEVIGDWIDAGAPE